MDISSGANDRKAQRKLARMAQDETPGLHPNKDGKMSEHSFTGIACHDDGDFIRTAIVCDHHGVSFDLLDTNGKRVALINAFVYPDGVLIVDVIDKDENYTEKHAMTFDNGQRNAIKAGSLVCADFRSK